MNMTLKSCPMCGDNVSIIEEIKDDSGRPPRPCRHYSIECCVDMTETSGNWWSGIDDAEENDQDRKAKSDLALRWNKRATD